MSVIDVPQLKGSRLRSPVDTGPNLRILQPGDFIPRGFALWRILTAVDGDKRIVWNPQSFLEIAEAAQLFKRLIKAGMVPYVCDDRGRPTAEVMTEFDATAGEVDFREVVWAPSKLAVGG